MSQGWPAVTAISAVTGVRPSSFRGPAAAAGAPRAAVQDAACATSANPGPRRVQTAGNQRPARRRIARTCRRSRMGLILKLMIGVEDQAAPAPVPAPADVPVLVPDPISHLSKVYRDYPGLRALILRRVRDPEVAADILQDAAVTTLEKLRSGEISHPENVGGYLYRVALNHLRNHRRKDRTALSSADGLDDLKESEEDPEWTRVGRPQWANAARKMLEEMPAARDRDLLVRFYLNDEAKEQICQDLRLSTEHFNRVIFRARNRFRVLLEQRGIWKADLLSIALLSMGLAAGGASLVGAARAARDAPAAACVSTCSQGEVA